MDDTLGKLRTALERLAAEGEAALPALGELYATDVCFQDPLQTLRGREAFLDSTRRLVRRAREIRFDIGSAMRSGDEICLVWTMRYVARHGLAFSLEGMSHLRLRDGLVAYQRDYCDPWGTLAAAVPGFGRLYPRLVRYLA